MKNLKELKVKTKEAERLGITLSGATVIENLVTINRDCKDSNVKNLPNRNVTDREVTDLANKIINDPKHLYEYFVPMFVNGDTLHILDGQHTYYAIKYAAKIAKRDGIVLDLNEVPVRVELIGGEIITARNPDGTIDMDGTMALEEKYIRNLNLLRKNWTDSDIIRAGLESSDPEIKENFLNLEEIKKYIINLFGRGTQSCNNGGYYRLADYISKGKQMAHERKSIGKYNLDRNETLRSKNIIDLLKDIEDVIIPMGSKLYIYNKPALCTPLIKGVRELYLDHSEEFGNKELREQFLKNISKININTDKDKFDTIMGLNEVTYKDDIIEVLESCM